MANEGLRTGFRLEFVLLLTLTLADDLLLASTHYTLALRPEPRPLFDAQLAANARTLNFRHSRHTVKAAEVGDAAAGQLTSADRINRRSDNGRQ
ncbi:MAG: hypothetical protein ACRETM_03235 [Stenotrophobium sp.]